MSAAGPAVAWADDDDDDDEPVITRAPSLSGSALVGSRLDAVGASWRGRHVTANWRWLRCQTDSWRTCALIDGASSSSYGVTSADLGKRLRVVLWVSNRDGYDIELSPATAAVAAPPPPPAPPRPPVVVPPRPPVVVPPPVVTLPSPPPTVQVPATPAPPAVPVPPAVATPPRRMRPAPTIRVRGWLTLRGARITLLTVRAPRGARISVSCTGIGCPRNARSSKLTRLRRFEGMYRAGARIVIRVTRPGFVGKHTVIRIRRGRVPLKRDRCLFPGTRGPSACQVG